MEAPAAASPPSAGDGSPPSLPGLLAGFDAGQTHTTCRLAAGCGGPPLAQGEGPGVRHLAAPGGAEAFQEALRRSLAAARHHLPADLRERPLLAAVAGASGIEAGSPVAEQGAALAATVLGLPAERVGVSGDERTALAGAFGGGAGIVVISGTGTIAVGSDGRGRLHRCAGWGWLLDEAGSAMDIGRDALALSLRMADGRIDDGPLRAELWAGLGLAASDPQAPQRIKAMVVEAGFGPAGFARLAPLVAALAERGDSRAHAILGRHAAALAAMAEAVARTLQLETPDVCTMGGALEHLGMLRKLFADTLDARLQGHRLVSPRGDACDGALQEAAALLEAGPPGATLPAGSTAADASLSAAPPHL